MPDITIADVDQAEAALADAKARKQAGDASDYVNVKRRAVQTRVGWRQQEEAAGRRNGKVGGDAVQTGG